MIGFLRGNAVRWDGERWRTPAGEDGEQVTLRCPHCGAALAPGEPDACLGTIDGAAGACCGHGVHVGYINWPGIPAPAGWWQRAYLGTEAVG